MLMGKLGGGDQRTVRNQVEGLEPYLDIKPLPYNQLLLLLSLLLFPKLTLFLRMQRKAIMQSGFDSRV